MKPDKLCALTFDDGPDAEKTPLVLDKLERYGAVATFMMVGHCVSDATKPVIERVVSRGCEIGNHAGAWDSMSHMTDAEIRDSVRKTSEAIARYSGKEPRFFRPPNLAVSDAMHDAVGLPFVGGVTGRDWAGCGTSAETRARLVLSLMRDGAIILLHDVQPDPHPTPEALYILIPELKRRGYEFVTLSELFARKGVTPDPKARLLWEYVE